MKNASLMLSLLWLLFSLGCNHSNPIGDKSPTIQVQDFILAETGIDINDSITKRNGPYLFTGPRIEKLGAQLYFLGADCLIIEDYLKNKFYMSKGVHELSSPIYFNHERDTPVIIEAPYKEATTAIEEFFNSKFRDTIFTYEEGKMFFDSLFNDYGISYMPNDYLKIKSFIEKNINDQLIEDNLQNKIYRQYIFDKLKKKEYLDKNKDVNYTYWYYYRGYGFFIIMIKIGQLSAKALNQAADKYNYTIFSDRIIFH